MKVGIDFGTTRTVVASALGGRYAVVSFDAGDSFADYLPGVVVRAASGELAYGWEALELLRTGHPLPAVRSIKRRVSGLGPDDPVTELGPNAPTALELVTGFLSHLRAALVHSSNLPVTEAEPIRATVAVPANASSGQRYLTLEGFTRAGFSVDSMLNEPTAAAVEFAHRSLKVLGGRSPKRYMVVYDLGGGTFDTAAVSLENRQFQLLSSEGIARLGGNDFDECIADAAVAAAGIEGALIGNKRVALLECCREAKESLTSRSKKLLIDLSEVIPGQEPVMLDTGDVYAACQPLLDRTITMVNEVFEGLVKYGIDPNSSRELGGVYLVGGGVAFPPVARALRAKYGRKIQLAPQPHAATAVGLCVCGDPEADVFVREAATRHFGVWREGRGGETKVFDSIIAKGDAPAGDEPLVVRRSYRPTHTVGTLRFLECTRLDDAGQPSGDVTPWSRVMFPYDPSLVGNAVLSERDVNRSEAVSGELITETYTYTSGGIIDVVIENTTGGYRRNFRLRGPTLRT